MTRLERIRAVVEDYSTSDLIGLVSSINGWDGSLDEQGWREMDIREIWDSCDCSSTFESILSAAANGDFNPRDDYYRWDYYGDLESSDDPDFDLDEIAEWIDDNFDDLRRALGEYFAEDFDECSADEDYDESEYPEDPTDYDGVDDADEEDEPTEEAADPAPAEPADAHELDLDEFTRVMNRVLGLDDFGGAHNPAYWFCEATAKSTQLFGHPLRTENEVRRSLQQLGFCPVA